MSRETSSSTIDNENSESEQVPRKGAGIKLAKPRKFGGSVRLRDLLDHQQDVFAQIKNFIVAGAFSWVAAQAAGVTSQTFNKWMMKGRMDVAAGRISIYSRFFREIMQAQALARLQVEITVKSQDPKFWLNHGPGKTRQGEPGWTDTLAMGGAEELEAIQLAHSGSANGTDEESIEVSSQELAKSLDILAQLGYIELGPKGITINGVGPVVNGHLVQTEEDEDDGDETSNEGHYPERKTPYKDIPTPKPE